MSEKSFCVAVEGGDGSGKGTQTELLRETLQSIGKNVLKVSFPRYGKPAARFVENYLNGVYGASQDVPADLASLAYAIDRFDATPEIKAHLALPDSVVLFDRWVGSNLAHQAARIDDAGERIAFYESIMQVEYGILGEPEPDLNVVLLVPAHIAQANVDKKDASIRGYSTQKRDIHEADANHLELAKRNYQELCELYPERFISINCMDGDEMRPIEDIRADIWALVETQIA